VFDRVKGGRLDVLVAAHQGRFGLPGAVRDADVASGRQRFDGAVADDTFGRSERALLALHHHVHLADGGHLETRLHGQWRHTRFIENYTGFLLNETAGDRRRQAQAGLQGGLRTRYGQRLVPGLGLEVGLDATVESLDQEEVGVDANHRTLDTRRDLDVSQQTGAALAGLTFRPLDAPRLDAGGRFDVFRYDVADRLAPTRSGADVVMTPSPRVTIAWDVLPEPRAVARPGESGPLTLFAAYGRGFRAPEARAVTASATPGATDGAGARREYY
jgi:outer membrane receptor protein involved in Fe transport